MGRLDAAASRRAFVRNAAQLTGAGVLALSPAGAAAQATPAAGGWIDPRLEDAFARIDRFVKREMDANGTPGLALAITDRSGLVAVRQYGYADLAAELPVEADTLFEFGSIGKAFTAICLLQLAEAGTIDLQAPVSRYLPWFAVQSEYAPITVHHLLNHTAGIIGGSDFSPDSRYEVWMLRETTAGGPPGERFHYSNVGYKALGLLLEAVVGKPYGTIVQEQIFDPLGMEPAANVITHEVRKRLAVGYVPFYDDRPHRREYGLVPATWLESDTGDGSLSASAGALAAFMRMILNRGVGPDGPVLSAASFDLLLGPHIEIEPGVGYGYGIETTEVDGQTVVGHAGGMVGYASSMFGVLEAGIGAVALINGPGDDSAAVEFALRAVGAALAGDELPELPPAADGTVAANAGDYAGIYRRATAALEVTAEGDRLALVVDGAPVGLESRGDDLFLVDHPDFTLFPLRFGRDEQGTVVEVIHGPDWYASDTYSGPTSFDTPVEWAAYPGHYRSHNPWFTNFRVALRKGQLWLLYPDGGEEVLTPDGALFRPGEDEWVAERLGFAAVVDGIALRAEWAGGDSYYYRFFTP